MMADSTSHIEHDPVGTQKSGNDEAKDWRIQRYLEMEFNGELAFSRSEAEALADSVQYTTTGGKDKNSKKLHWKPPLNWQRVQKALDGGCDPALALELFVTTE